MTTEKLYVRSSLLNGADLGGGKIIWETEDTRADTQTDAPQLDENKQDENKTEKGEAKPSPDGKPQETAEKTPSNPKDAPEPAETDENPEGGEQGEGEEGEPGDGEPTDGEGMTPGQALMLIAAIMQIVAAQGDQPGGDQDSGEDRPSDGIDTRTADTPIERSDSTESSTSVGGFGGGASMITLATNAASFTAYLSETQAVEASAAQWPKGYEDYDGQRMTENAKYFQGYIRRDEIDRHDPVYVKESQDIQTRLDRHNQDPETKRKYAEIAHAMRPMIQTLKSALHLPAVLPGGDAIGYQSGTPDSGSFSKLYTGETNPAVFCRRMKPSRPRFQVGLIIDDSGSMGMVSDSRSPMAKARNVTVALLEALNHPDIDVVLTHIQGLDEDIILGASDLLGFASVAQIKASGGNYTPDSILRLRRHMGYQRERQMSQGKQDYSGKIIINLTDGGESSDPIRGAVETYKQDMGIYGVLLTQQKPTDSEVATIFRAYGAENAVSTNHLESIAPQIAVLIGRMIEHQGR